MPSATIRTRWRSWLPRGPADFAFQTVFWLVFYFGYQVVQAGAGHDRAQALANGLRVADLERDLTHRLVELSVQDFVRDSGVLNAFATVVYRGSEFVVVALALLWVYLRRNEAFTRLRNTLIVTNTLALIVFYVLPTAPPRAFPALGFVNGSGSLSSGGHLIPSNPYAAMPSLHSADALIVGVYLALLVRPRVAKALWLLWPVLVWFAVVGTANHFWLDIVGGIVVAAVGTLAVAAYPAARSRVAVTRARSSGSVAPSSLLSKTPDPESSTQRP